MHARRDQPYGIDGSRHKWGGGWGTVILLIVLVVTPLALLRFAGPPRPPAAFPDPGAIRTALTSTNPDLSGALPWCLLGAWLLWLWLLASVALQVAVALLDVVTRGAAWVRVLRPFVDACTATLARRAVTGFAATTFFLEGLKLTASAAGAAPAPPSIVTTVAEPLTRSAGEGGSSHHALGEQPVEHIVVSGDTLWGLAERYYGDGREWPRIGSANQGRIMPDGRPFSGVLRPGDVLLVPNPTHEDVATHGDGGATIYVVKGGDTLRGIAGEQLGDEARWSELAVEGRGPVLQALADPDVIRPGLRLVVPAAPAPAQPDPVATPSPPPPPAPATATPITPSPPSPTTATPALPSVTSTPAAPAAGPATPAAQPMTPPAASPTAAPPRPSATPPAVVGIAPTVTAAPPAPALPSPAADATQPAGDDTDAGPIDLLGRGVAGIGAGLVVGAVALLAAKHLLRRNLRAARTPTGWDDDPEDTPRDFAPTDEAVHVFEHRVKGGETEPAVVIAGHTAHFLAEEEVADARILLAVHERGRSTLVLRAPEGEHTRLVALAPALGAKLGGKGKAMVPHGAGDVELRLSGVTAAALLGAPFCRSGGRTTPTLVPFAAQPNGSAVFANWDTLEHVLVAGDDGDAVETVLTSLIAELASRRSPDDLRLWAIARPRLLPYDLLRLPHWGVAAPLAPDDPDAVVPFLDALRAELVDRMDEAAVGQPGEHPEIVLVLGDLAEPFDDGSDGTTLELLGREGPAHGIRIVAATMRPAETPDALLSHFATRFVLELADEAQSVRFLGTPAAVGLGGGRLLPRLAGRPPAAFNGFPPRLFRGQRIAPEDLAALVGAIRQHYDAAANEPQGDRATERADHGEVAAARATLPNAGTGRGGSRAPERTPSTAGDQRPGPASSRRMTSIEPPAGPTPIPQERSAAPVAEHDETVAGSDQVRCLSPSVRNTRRTDPVAPNIEPEGAESAGRAAWAQLEHVNVPSTTGWASGNTTADEPLPTVDGAVGESRMAGHHARTSRSGPDCVDVHRNAHDAPREHAGHNSPSEARRAAGAVAPGGTSQEELGGSCGGATTDQTAHEPADGSGAGATADDRRAVECVIRERTGEHVVALPPQMPVSPGRSASRMPVGSRLESEAPESQGSDELAPAETDTPTGPRPSGTAEAAAPEGNLPALDLRCFGGPLRIYHGESELSDQNRQQQRSLLAFLAVAPPGPVDTDRIREALWPERDPRQSQDWLHKAIWQLRKLLTDQVPGLPTQVVRSGRNGTYWLDPELVDSDVHRFYRLLDDMQRLPLEEAVEQFRSATALLADDLLVGERFTWLDADPEGDGLRAIDRLARALRRRADVLVRRCRVANRHQLAVQVYELLLERKPTDEPLDEKVLRELFRSHFAARSLAGLLRAEREGRALLRLEYTVPDLPDDPVEDRHLYEFEPDTENLLKELKAELEGSGTGRAAIGRPGEPDMNRGRQHGMG